MPFKALHHAISTLCPVSRRGQSGNVVMYLLIAVVLFAALSMLITRASDSDRLTDTLNADRANLRAQELINYAAAAKQVVEQIAANQTNFNPDTATAPLDFVLPGDPNFHPGTTAQRRMRVYHPEGGGLSVFVTKPDYYPATGPQDGWVWQRGQNYVWSPTTATDVLISFPNVHPDICRAINRRLYNLDAIPATTIITDTHLVFGAPDAPITAAECPTAECNGRPSLCVSTQDGSNTFFSLVFAR